MNNNDTLYPCSFVIFGATGHLAATKLLPALYSLEAQGRLPDVTNFIAFARRAWDDQAWCTHMDEALRLKLGSASTPRCSASSPPASAMSPVTCRTSKLTSACWKNWVKPKTGVCSNIVYYLAIKPSDFVAVANNLAAVGLNRPRGLHRVVVEKPFGEDLESAQVLNQVAAPALRRAPDLPHRSLPRQGDGAEPARLPLRQRDASSRCGTAATSTTCRSRSAKRPASRPAPTTTTRPARCATCCRITCMQLMTLVAHGAAARAGSRRPARREGEGPALDPADRPSRTARPRLRAQYRAGAVDGKQVPGYQDEPGVEPGSITETFVAAKLLIDNWRWRGVPFTCAPASGCTTR